MSRGLLHLRVSSRDQDPKLQERECLEFMDARGVECVKVFVEKCSAWKDESKREVFHEMLEYAKSHNIDFIVVWNMDRFSRQPEERVLEQVKKLSLLHNIQVVAVHGDAWSELVESVGKFKEMGFVGQALSDFLETIIRGYEFRRAHRESEVKSERVKLAVKVKDGVTVSRKGKKWGRRSLPKRVRDEVLRKRREGMTIREIASSTMYYDKHRNEKKVSVGKVQQIINDDKECSKKVSLKTGVN